MVGSEPSVESDSPQFLTFNNIDAQRVLACCTERTGGVSEDPYRSLNLGFHVGDDAGAVAANRQLLADALGVSLGAFVVPRQVHRGNVHVVDVEDRGRGARSHDDAIPGTDALVTRQPDVVLAVLLADCVPVILFDPETPAVGVAHAGWGGTVHHITRRTVETMTSAFGTDPSRLRAALGPAIGPKSYEVGDDVAERAAAEFPTPVVIQPKGDGRYLFDLWASNVADLQSAGVPRDHIEVAAVDTFDATDRFFSDRRVRPTGRLMALAMLR